MARKKIVNVLASGDAPRPTVMDGRIAIKAPYSFTVAPGAKVVVKTDTAFSEFVYLAPPTEHLIVRLSGTEREVVYPGQKISLEIVNPHTSETFTVQPGETICFALVMGTAEVELA